MVIILITGGQNLARAPIKINHSPDVEVAFLVAEI
jgi:hypothetical protein